MKPVLIMIVLLTAFLNTRAQSNIVLKDSLFVFCDYEILASFPGGINEFNRYLKKNIDYPASAVKSRIHGKVILDFTIEKDGRVDDIKVVQGVSPDLDAEAIRVLENSPKWIPTTDCGKPVRTQYRIPIAFQLPKAKSN